VGAEIRVQTSMLIDGLLKLGWHKSTRLPETKEALRAAAARLCKDASRLSGRHLAILLSALTATGVSVEACELAACMRRLVEVLETPAANVQVCFRGCTLQSS
jgi:hypothetical protein